MTDAEIITTDNATIALLNKSEIDQQIATAHQYPRSVTVFRKDATSMVSLSADVAAECIYSIPRDGKQITGPSVRFAEIVASCWGNSRAGARIVAEDERFVTAQGVFHDLQRNVAITYEVKRRITNKNGRRFSDDMIGNTANAASSIALRNAILKGVPKAFWNEVYIAAISTAKGDTKSLPQRRAAALAAFEQQGFTEKEVFGLIDVKGKSDIDIDKLFELSGILTALSDGDTTKTELLRNANVAPAPAPPPPKVSEPLAQATASATPPPIAQKPEEDREPAQELDHSRGPDEVLEELENICSGLVEGNEEELAQLEDDYVSAPHPSLEFPPDRKKAADIIAATRERIAA